MDNWKFASYIEVDKEFKIEGINIWNHYWHCSDRKVEVRSPEEGQVYFFKEYQINNGGQTIRFVAGEFSDSRVGLYLKDKFTETGLS